MSKAYEIMGNKSQAIYEVLGHELDGSASARLFNKIYVYILYNDLTGFLKLLEYRRSLCEPKKREDYSLFKFMLQWMVAEHPSKLRHLFPAVAA